MIADSGARLVVADAATIGRPRGVREYALAGVDDVDADRAGASPASWSSTASRPRRDGVRPTCAPRGPAGAAAARPGEAGGPALHQRTSGRPRAAMLTHRALLANLEQVAEVEPADDPRRRRRPRGAAAVPRLRPQRRARRRAPAPAPSWCSVERFDPDDTLDLIDDEAVSVVPIAPPVFAALAARGRRPRRAARLGPAGAVRLGAAVRARSSSSSPTITGIAVHQGYGLTEAAPGRHQHPGQRAPPARLGRRRAARHRASGWSTTPARRRRARTRARSRSAAPTSSAATGPTVAAGPDADGWWSTGDVGFLDPTGDLFLVDRIKELIIVSGFNVYPVEVEEVVREVRRRRPRRR